MMETGGQKYERADAAGKGRGARFQRTSLSAIMEMKFEPIRWAVHGYIPEGFSILAGRQKLGKTWLALGCAIAIGTGGVALGNIPCEQGDVLYLDLENGNRRVQRRIETLFPYATERPDLRRVEIVTTSPRLDQGFIEALEEWRHSVASPRLVVIDVLQRIKPPQRKNHNAYESDYSIFAPLQAWAMQTGIAVVGLTHTKKGFADDPLEMITGSNGLSAVADTSLILNKTADGVTLYVRGRDVEERDTALKNVNGMWVIEGDAVEVRQSAERARILSALLTAEELLTPADIASATGMKRNAVDQLLLKLGRDGLLLKAGRGKYAHRDHEHLIPEEYR